MSALSKYEKILITQKLVRSGLLKADPRFLENPLEVLEKICNGCGAAGKLDLVPDTCWGMPMWPACIIHDFDYHYGVTEADRKFSDARMRNNAILLAKDYGILLYLARRIRINTYYQAVRIGGEEPFWVGKSANVVTLKEYHANPEHQS